MEDGTDTSSATSWSYPSRVTRRPRSCPTFIDGVRIDERGVDVEYKRGVSTSNHLEHLREPLSRFNRTSSLAGVCPRGSTIMDEDMPQLLQVLERFLAGSPVFPLLRPPG